MRTRKIGKEPDPDDDAPGPTKQIKKKTLTKSRIFHGNKVTCGRHKAVATFYKVKD